VTETVPAERLLVFQVSDGWQPLARFLGAPVPHAPFPRLNDTATLRSLVGLPSHRYGLRPLPARPATAPHGPARLAEHRRLSPAADRQIRQEQANLAVGGP
jgi:hypothetical protein